MKRRKGENNLKKLKRLRDSVATFLGPLKKSSKETAMDYLSGTLHAVSSGVIHRKELFPKLRHVVNEEMHFMLNEKSCSTFTFEPESHNSLLRICIASFETSVTSRKLGSTEEEETRFAYYVLCDELVCKFFVWTLRMNTVDAMWVGLGPMNLDELEQKSNFASPVLPLVKALVRLYQSEIVKLIKVEKEFALSARCLAKKSVLALLCCRNHIESPFCYIPREIFRMIGKECWKYKDSTCWFKRVDATFKSFNRY